MNDVVKNEVIKKLSFISEKDYKQFKHDMWKFDDYFSLKELISLNKKEKS